MGGLCSSENGRSRSGGSGGSNAPSDKKKGDAAGRHRVPLHSVLESFVLPFGLTVVQGDQYRIWLKVGNDKAAAGGSGGPAHAIDFDWDEFPTRFAGIREVCRDGNCFYTAFLLGMAEYIATIAPAVASAAAATASGSEPSPSDAAAAASAEALYSSFDRAMATATAESHAVGVRTPASSGGRFASFLRACALGRYPPHKVAGAVDNGDLESAVANLRVRLALEMQADMGNILPFLIDDEDDYDHGSGDAATGTSRRDGEDRGDYFLRSSVIRMGSSAGELHMSYIARLFPIGIRVERPGAGGWATTFPPSGNEVDATVVLLHTPGHFELAYLQPPACAKPGTDKGDGQGVGEGEDAGNDKPEASGDDTASDAGDAEAGSEYKWPVAGGGICATTGVPVSAYAVTQAVMGKKASR